MFRLSRVGKQGNFPMIKTPLLATSASLQQREDLVTTHPPLLYYQRTFDHFPSEAVRFPIKQNSSSDEPGNPAVTGEECSHKPPTHRSQTHTHTSPPGPILINIPQGRVVATHTDRHGERKRERSRGKTLKENKSSTSSIPA